MTRKRLTELGIQELWIEHRSRGFGRKREPIPGRAFVDKLQDDGQRVGILLPFNPLKNEELTHFVFGVEYEIDRREFPELTLQLALDGTFRATFEAEVVLTDLSHAIASSEGTSVKILRDCPTGTDKLGIWFDRVTNRFVRTKDLKNRAITIYKAKCVAPRWVESKKEFKVGEKGPREAEAPLEYCYVCATAKGKKGDSEGMAYYRWKADVEFIPAIKRGLTTQAANTRKIFVENLVLEEEKFAAYETASSSRA